MGSNDKTTQIIDATFKLLQDKRYYEITTDDIAGEAKVGKGTLYRYFKDKDDLLIQLASTIIVRIAGLCKESISKVSSLRERLIVLGATCQTFLKENPAIFKVINEEYDIFMKRLEEQPMCEHHRPFYELIGGIFEEAIESGELKTDHDQFFLVVTFKALMRGTSELNFFLPEQPINFEETVDFFLKGVTN